MQDSNSIQIPQEIIWYPASGSDFFAAIIPVLLDVKAIPKVKHIENSVSSFRPFVAHPRVLAEYPVIMNDADETLFNQLNALDAPVTLYEKFQVNHDVVGGSRIVWKQLSSASVTLIKRASFSIDIPIIPPVDEPALTTLFPEPSTRLRLKSTSDDASLLPVRILELELQVSYNQTTYNIPVWFVLSDALDFIDSIAPFFELQIVGLIMIRTQCSSKRGRPNEQSFSANVLNQVRQHPDRYEQLKFAWFDSTVRETRNNPWRLIDVQKVDYDHDDLPSSYHVNVPLRFRERAHDAFYHGFHSIAAWGGRGANLFVPAHAFKIQRQPNERFSAYWVLPGLLMGGRWPAKSTQEQTEEYISQLFDLGIRTFINLVSTAESDAYYDVHQYEDIARSVSMRRGINITIKHFPMVDMGVCEEVDELNETLTFIDSQIEKGDGVYVHCRAGLGRTGIVLAAWLKKQRVIEVRNAPIAYLNALRFIGGQNMSYSSPQSAAQFEFIETFDSKRAR